jgi:NADH-ubiquinone oxidoreductase chain 5
MIVGSVYSFMSTRQMLLIRGLLLVFPLLSFILILSFFFTLPAPPTPISALVHSSTLVTSGLYLMIRHSYLLYSSPLFLKLLIVLRVFTSFYAGLNSIFETDFKKLIALSTLRHLDLIHLSFFHMLTHALFKSLLFITIGDIIINLNHSQDTRYYLQI